MALPRVLTAALALGALIALSACTIVSKAPLVAPEEAAAPFSGNIAVAFYGEKEGLYLKSEDAPMSFMAAGPGYEAADKSMKIYFVPRPDGSQLVAITATDGNLYGWAKLFDNGVLELHLILDADPVEALKAAPPDLAAQIKPADGGVEVMSRAALDFVIDLVAKGEIAKGPMVGFVIEEGGPAAPTSIVKSADGWTLN